MVEGYISRLYIQMEFCVGGDLHSYLQSRKGDKLEVDKIFDYFLQLCRAVKVRISYFSLLKRFSTAIQSTLSTEI